MAEDEFFKRIAQTAEPDDVVSDRPAGTAERRARQRAETQSRKVAANDGQEKSPDDAPGEHLTLLSARRRGHRAARSKAKRSEKLRFRAHLTMICAALIGICGIGVGMVVAPRGDSDSSSSVQPRVAQLDPSSIAGSKRAADAPAARPGRVDRQRRTAGPKASRHSRSSEREGGVASTAGVLPTNITGASASAPTREGFGIERGR